MSVFVIRVLVFTILPVVSAALIARLDPTAHSSRRRPELYLTWLFGLGVAGSGIGGFIGHLFLSDVVAESIGWPAGSPFQQEMAFANLALGGLGLVATGRRDGFREATVVAVTILGLGASIVHIVDIVQTGNLAPGNTVQNGANVLKPVLLIIFLRASRRADTPSPESGPEGGFSRWQIRQARAVGWMTAMVSTGFGVGFSTGELLLGTALGLLAGSMIVWILLTRKPKTVTGGRG